MVEFKIENGIVSEIILSKREWKKIKDELRTYGILIENDKLCIKAKQPKDIIMQNVMCVAKIIEKRDNIIIHGLILESGTYVEHKYVDLNVVNAIKEIGCV